MGLGAKCHTEFGGGVPALNAYGLLFNVANPMPDYWMVNGLSFPNTIHAPSLQGGGFLWDWWAPAHPGYETFYEGSVNAKLGRGEKVLIRMINIGPGTADACPWLPWQGLGHGPETVDLG